MSEPQLPPYPTLGRYQVINRIASGGMAEVFLARAVGAMGFQRLVAIKLIHSNFTREPDFVNMFIDEARIAMHLHHRNIVQVFDLDSEGQTYFIAMEYVHGVNLYDLYDRLAGLGRWVDLPIALYMVAEISKGLHFAHTRTGTDGHALGIVHRDISPQNVLLSFEGEVKIADFGIATAAERLHKTAAGIVKGKYAYMAPERLQEQPVDARVDVFSVGVLLYELLVGENPFAGSSAVETIENVLGRDVPSPSSRGAPVSRRLDEICLRALEKDPARRFPTAHAFADAVTEYAMEVTMARKDMASGDAALAALLAELFPDEAATPPEAAPPHSIDLPGLSDEAGQAAVATQEGPPEPELLNTDEALPVADTTVPTPIVGPNAAEDFDAPTILRLSAVSGGADPEAPTSSNDVPVIDAKTDAAIHARREISLESLETPRDPNLNLDSAPTELPPPPRGVFAGPPPTADDPFAQTLPSRSSLEDLEHESARRAAHAPQILPRAPSPKAHGMARPKPAPLHSVPLAQQTPPPPVRGPGGSSEISIQGSAGSPINYVATLLLAVAAIVVVAALIMARNREPTTVLIPIAISSQPPGAFVKVDDVSQDQLTPLRVELSTHQVHVIELSKSGYRAERREISPQDGDELQIDVKLTATSGALSISPDPSNARISINGTDHGEGQKTIDELPLDQALEVLVELEGYQPEVRRLTLKADDPHRHLTLKLDRSARRTVRRRVTVKAPYGSWAKVYYNGRLLGTTPVKALLPVGNNVRLRVKNENVDKTVKVRVPSRGSNEIEVQF